MFQDNFYTPDIDDGRGALGRGAAAINAGGVGPGLRGDAQRLGENGRDYGEGGHTQ